MTELSIETCLVVVVGCADCDWFWLLGVIKSCEGHIERQSIIKEKDENRDFDCKALSLLLVVIIIIIIEIHLSEINSQNDS